MTNSVTNDSRTTLRNIIPQALRNLRQWVVWKLEARNGKSTKVPYNPTQPMSCASTSDPPTWGTFHEAVTTCTEQKFSGVGFVFTKDDPYVGIDLDKCRDPETTALEPWAQNIVDLLDSYTEISQSGTGVHVIIQAKMTVPGHRKDRVEIYETGRFFRHDGRPYGWDTAGDYATTTRD